MGCGGSTEAVEEASPDDVYPAIGSDEPEVEAAAPQEADSSKCEQTGVDDVFPDMNRDALQDAFAKFDRDNNGSLSMEEFVNFTHFVSGGREPIPGAAEEMFASFDTNQDGRLSLNELGPFLDEVAATVVDSVNKLRDVFVKLDQNGDGQVDREEAKVAIAALENIPGISQEIILDTCFTCDGVLSYSEFGRAVFGAGFHSHAGLTSLCHGCEARALKTVQPPAGIESDEGYDASDFAEMNAALEEASNRVGLKFVWDQAPPGQGGATEGHPCNLKLLQMFAPLFIRELMLYPASFFLKGEAEGGYDWIETIYLSAGLKLFGQSVGGFAIPHEKALCVNALSIFETDPSAPSAFGRDAELSDEVSDWALCSFKQILHHELFHLLDFCLAYHRGVTDPASDDPIWRELNEPDFVYNDQKEGDGYTSRLASFSLQLNSGPSGFMNSYQCSSMLEDKGCVYGNLFAYPTYVEKKSGEDPIVGNKVALMKANLREYCDEMNEDFWTQPEMEKYKSEREISID